MTFTLSAFQGATARKDLFLSRVSAHRTANEVVPGPGFWDGTRGSLVGVTVHSNDAALFEAETGIAQGSLLAAERIWRLAMMRLGLHRAAWDGFEKSSLERMQAFPSNWLEAIEPGGNTGQVARLTMVACLERVLSEAKLLPDLRSLSVLLRALVDAHGMVEPPPASTWRGWRQACQGLVAAHRENTYQAALAEIAATAAWPCTESGGAVPDVIEQFVDLSRFDARRVQEWRAVEEESKRVLDAEREAILMDPAKRESGGISEYDEALITAFPEWVERDRALRNGISVHTLQRLADVESIFVGLLARINNATQE